MRQKKIRGLARRQKEIDDWFEWNYDIDLDLLNSSGYYYVKAKVGPWANLFTEKHYPSDYKKKILKHLLEIYANWEQKLLKQERPFYLKIWLYEHRFINSQVVAAVGEKINRYQELFTKVPKQHTFHKNRFDPKLAQLDKLSWSLHWDEDVFWESEFADLEDLKKTNIELYYHEKRLYKCLVKKADYKLLQNPYGENDKLFLIKKGNLWVGESHKGY
ncbi:hypothetical protein NF867_07600 [Solitalea sp. MAHUQ-68]|uniref:Uncharacterized protein n=1 Tax=Solitalea agri TaxID=2953739 RepID=A0A9X2F144_9SPHI|nr:hypothetical protein [Solitalea agri]MCO4292722.1 hypothetical protein [Solitalea agri]